MPKESIMELCVTLVMELLRLYLYLRDTVLRMQSREWILQEEILLITWC